MSDNSNQNDPTKAFNSATLLADFYSAVETYIKQANIPAPLIIGIHTGGVWLAKEVAQRLSAPMGYLDISFYRDDFTQHGLNPKVNPSHLPSDINNKDIILIDDVIKTGRTIRAALNEIFDYGRPKQVILATLCNINKKELPIQADICPLSINLADDEYVHLSGPHPLELSILHIDKSTQSK